MSSKITEIDVQVGLGEVAKISSQLDATCPEASPGKVDNGLRSVVERMILSHLSDGKAMTSAMQMPSGWLPVVMSYMTGDGAWKSSGPRIEVRLKNTSDRPVTIVHDIALIPRYDNRTGRQIGDSNSPVQIKLAPGDTVDLEGERAQQALYTYCRKACHPAQWINWSHSQVDPKTSTREETRFITSDFLEEVAFRARLTNSGKVNDAGEPISGYVESDGWSKKGTK